MLLPFILGLIIAYLLNPYVSCLERIFSSRIIAVLLILASFLSITCIIIMLVAPTLYYESLNFIKKVPLYVDLLQAKLLKLPNYLPESLSTWKEYFNRNYETYKTNINNNINNDYINLISNDLYKNFLKVATNFAQTLWNSALTIFNIIMVIIITPLVSFYLLKDWPKLIATLDGLIPRKYYYITKQQLEKINNNLSGYIRGQIKICFILAVFYAIALSGAGLEYSLFIGITTGLLGFIPYVGTFFGFIAAHLVAISQFEYFYRIIIITGIFISGELIESLILTPKLIGKSVDLHPLWIIFSIIVGGGLFGFTGVLLAVPMAAILSVLIRFFFSCYKDSHYYQPQDYNNNYKNYKDNYKDNEVNEDNEDQAVISDQSKI